MTLAKRIAVKGALEPEGAVDVLGQVGAGLEASHRAGVVHGTLGPASVVVESSGDELRAYLAGFGRAEGDRLEDLRDLGSILGAMLGEVEGDERRLALDEVVGRARGDEFGNAAELVAAAESAIGRRAGEIRGGGNWASALRSPPRWAVAVLALIALVAALAIAVGGGDDPGSSDAGSGPSPAPAPAVEPGDPSVTGDGSGAPASP